MDLQLVGGAMHLNQFIYNHIFKLALTNKMICIFDHDNEGKCQFNALAKKGDFKQIKLPSGYQYAYQDIKNTNVYIMLLPVPDHRTLFVNENSKYCYLSTELLFKDNDIPKQNRDFPSLNDSSVFGFKGKKVNFAKSNQELSKSKDIDFDGFRNTFDVVDEICKCKS